MSFRSVVIVACCVLLLLFAAGKYPAVTVHAGIDFQPVSPEELKMTGEPLAPGAAAVILYRQVDRDDSSSGRIHEDNYYRIKIFSDAGRKFGNVEIPFFKGVDEVVKIRARIIKPDGTTQEFDGKVFEKSLVKARGINYLAKTFNLPAVEPGCIIEYSYTLDLQHAYASHWILSEELFIKSAHFSLKPSNNNFFPFTLHTRWKNLPYGAHPTRAPIIFTAWRPATFQLSRPKSSCRL